MLITAYVLKSACDSMLCDNLVLINGQERLTGFINCNTFTAELYRVQLTLTGLTAKLEGLVVCNIMKHLCDIK